MFGLMEMHEKLDCAKAGRDMSLKKQLFAERRASELADEFTRLEVQIATILFAFAGIFLNSFNEGVTKFTSGGILGMKLSFTASLLFLVLSLASGLIHIKRKEKFWDELVVQRVSRVNEWERAVKGQTTFEEADAFSEGTFQGGKRHGIIFRSPVWTWLLQTICLGISVTILFVLFIIFLFQR